MLNELMNKAIELWRGDNVTLLSPHIEQDVLDALQKTRRPVSSDVIEFYTLFGGMEGMDRYCLSLWSVEKVVNENVYYPKPYLLFADFLIDSHLYCFKYENENTSSICIEWGTGEKPQQIADSVSSFFELYITEPAKLELLVS